MRVFLSTFVFNGYFMKKPVQGEPWSFRDYFRGTSTAHILGILGGVVWAVGTHSSFVAASAPRQFRDHEIWCCFETAR